ncbi:MAG: hypothetical protein ACOCSR_00115 [Wenzhouxiangella sp.]
MDRTLAITPLPLYNAHLGLSACPGMPSMVRGHGAIDAGVKMLRHWPAEAVLTLMESRELEMLGLGHLPERLQESIPLWLHLPIRDGDVPDVGWLERWQLARLLIAAILAEGCNVVIHCLAGVGRTGLVGGLCLIDAGICRGREAVEHVRAVHNVHAAETAEQEDFVESYTPASVLRAETVHEQLARVAALAGMNPVLDADGRVDRQRALRLVF